MESLKPVLESANINELKELAKILGAIDANEKWIILELDAKSRSLFGSIFGDFRTYHSIVKQVARKLNCHEYRIITLKTHFQFTGTMKVRQGKENPCYTTNLG